VGEAEGDPFTHGWHRLEAEGLLENLSGDAREARLALMTWPGRACRWRMERRRRRLPLCRLSASSTPATSATARGGRACPGWSSVSTKLLRSLGRSPRIRRPCLGGGPRRREAGNHFLARVCRRMPYSRPPAHRDLDGDLADANRDMVGEVFTQPGIDERELAMRYAAAATMAPLLVRPGSRVPDPLRGRSAGGRHRRSWHEAALQVRRGASPSPISSGSQAR
jgi:hypothetical protein